MFFTYINELLIQLSTYSITVIGLAFADDVTSSAKALTLM